MNFGEQIKKLRKEQNLTQQEMADKLNVSRQAVSNWENDKNLPDIEMLITMSQVFRLTLDELILGGTTQMNNMTEKLIRDGSTNKRVRMNLIGIIAGSILLILGFITLIAGIYIPPSMENYWSIAFSAFTLGGVATFLIIGVKHLVELFMNKDKTGIAHGKLLAAGGICMLTGILLYGISIIIESISGLIGITGITAGIILVIIAAVRSGK